MLFTFPTSEGCEDWALRSMGCKPGGLLHGLLYGAAGDDAGDGDEIGVAPDLLMKSMILDALKLSGKGEELVKRERAASFSVGRSGRREFVDPNKYRLGPLSRCAVMCRDTAESPNFSSFVTFSIIMAGVCVGVNSEYEHADVDVHARRRGVASAELGQFLWFSDTIINWIFSVELVLKLLGEDWHPWTFFWSNWNCFDFCIVVCSWIPYFVNAGGLSTLKMLRLLRLFRILRIVKFLPQLAVIVDSLIEALESIGFIALILGVCFYMFAILGMLLFAKNDPFHFGFLHRAMLTLFRMCTFEDWTDVMYINIYGCMNWGYADDDSLPKHKLCSTHYLVTESNMNWIAVFYFIAFVVLGSWVLLTLFIGVVTTSMGESQEKHEMKMQAFERMVEAAAKEGVSKVACKGFLAAFERIDADGSGLLTVDELSPALRSVGFPADEATILKALNRLEDKVSPSGEADPFDFYRFLLHLTSNQMPKNQKVSLDVGDSLRADDGGDAGGGLEPAPESTGGEEKQVAASSPLPVQGSTVPSALFAAVDDLGELERMRDGLLQRTEALRREVKAAALEAARSSSGDAQDADQGWRRPDNGSIATSKGAQLTTGTAAPSPAPGLAAGLNAGLNTGGGRVSQSTPRANPIPAMATASSRSHEAAI